MPIGFDTGAHKLTKLEISHVHGMHVNVHAPIKCHGERCTTRTVGSDTGAHELTKLEISHAHGMHVSVVHRSPSHFICACNLTCMDEAAPVPLVMADMSSSPLLEHRTEQNP